MDKWHGKVAVVTGASKGLGRVIAMTLAMNKMKVIVCARSEDKLKSLQSEGASKGCTIDIMKCDMTVVDQVINFFRTIYQKYGAIHVCVNNAGLAFPDYFVPPKDNQAGDEPLTKDKIYSPESVKARTCMYHKWLTTLEVNVLGLGICSREALTIMIAAGVNDGVIINVSSIVGVKTFLSRIGPPQNYMHMYEASKFAVTALTDLLRMEIQLHPNTSGNRIVTLCPGLIHTDWPDALLEGSKKGSSVDPNKFFKDVDALRPEDVCQAVMTALTVGTKVQIDQIIVTPTHDPKHKPIC